MLKTSFVLNNKSFKRIKFDYNIVIHSTIFLCGVIIGVLFIKNCDDELKNVFFNLLDNYISTKSNSGFIGIFSFELVLLLVFVMFEFIFGLSAVGSPFVVLILAFFGVFSGAGASCIILNWGLKGVFYLLLVILPCYTITAAILVKCCCLSIRTSLILLNSILQKDIIKRNFCDFKEYVLNYLILIVPILIGVIISTILFKIFCTFLIVA